MRQEIERAGQEADGVRAYALALYYFMVGNISLMTIVMGGVCIALGATFVNGTPAIVIGGDAGPISLLNGIPEQYQTFGQVSGVVLAHKIFAAMLGIFGVTLMVLGATAYGFLLANKLYARATTSA
ncbi:hypothetical protein HZS55_16575 [Halosimplex rubrum]|uniref:Uncharacterized protein n=1 Tax=Halosimplex rubrum TaxID=869889 RepID=A0A7D5P5F8_9EURY|nr:hypothetical protein [Halosimplex rubrum]QLH78804.1 hypothetical protein HZS55_16575 [Halosimplex rubrum]